MERVVGSLTLTCGKAQICRFESFVMPAKAGIQVDLVWVKHRNTGFPPARE